MMGGTTIACSVAVALAAALFEGCGSSPEPVYYTLASQNGTQRAGPTRVVLIRRPTIADYLDRDAVVTGVDDHRLRIAAGDRWASPLADMIGRVLLEDLSTRLPGSTVVSEPLELATDPEVSVDVDVQRFESGEDGVVALQASVVLEVRRADRVLRSRTVRLSAGPSAPGTGPLVETLSVLLGRLADAAVDLVAGA